MRIRLCYTSCFYIDGAGYQCNKLVQEHVSKDMI